ncbi:Dynein heavy chain 8; axonemal [Camelus dromedarius]|uniref:Dynein heavy chain 8 n=1 Tax=Camelus dromedarius TaxID=9838 RepID=A0A5N4CR71_CAMDR|nr:Dynein heavy chain 8; axonemal [Camelus dromedarius]
MKDFSGEVQIQAFMNSTFGKILSSQQALQLLQRFQKLNIPCLQLEINHTVERILQYYVAELEATKKAGIMVITRMVLQYKKKIF